MSDVGLPPVDMAALTLRWALINRSKKAHLWLGQSTPCGRTFSRGTLEAYDPLSRDVCCEVCWAYAIGWVDGRRWGPERIRVGERDPRCWRTAGVVLRREVSA